MNTLQHMDKQQQMMDLMNRRPPQQPQPQEQIRESSSGRIVNGGDYSGTEGETLAPSYDLQDAVPVPTWASMAYPNFSSASILEPQVRRTEERTVSSSYGAVILAEIDRTVNKYTDNLLHALEGVSVRLSQLESRAYHIESSMGDLNLAVGNYTGTTDGRLLQFENILREVQSGFQILRDKQEIIKPPPPPRGGYQQSAPHDHQPHPQPQLPTPSLYTSYYPNPTSQPPQGPPPYMQQPPPGGGSLHRPFLIPPPPPLLTSTMYNQPPASVRFGGGSPSYISSSTVGIEGDRYEKLPIAKVLPKAAPVGTGSGSTGNQVPLDDVVEKVAMMGFSREQVRDTVKELTENGQDVDLNVILDKLMNGGDAGGDTIIQPRKGWFGR